MTPPRSRFAQSYTFEDTDPDHTIRAVTTSITRSPSGQITVTHAPQHHGEVWTLTPTPGSSLDRYFTRLLDSLDRDGRVVADPPRQSAIS